MTPAPSSTPNSTPITISQTKKSAIDKTHENFRTVHGLMCRNCSRARRGPRLRAVCDAPERPPERPSVGAGAFRGGGGAGAGRGPAPPRGGGAARRGPARAALFLPPRGGEDQARAPPPAPQPAAPPG